MVTTTKGSTKAMEQIITQVIESGGSVSIVDGKGDGMSFKKYPSLCTKCKTGKVIQENGICTYVMCRFQNKSVF